MSREFGSNDRRIAAGILSVLMLLIVLFSACYIAAETDHDCAGEDCPICACIQLCETILRQTGHITVSVLMIIIPAAFVSVSTLSLADAFLRESLVSRKIRLNN